MMQSKRSCDSCGHELPRRLAYFRLQTSVLIDDAEPYTGSAIPARSESDLCMTCAAKTVNPKEFEALVALLEKSKR